MTRLPDGKPAEIPSFKAERVLRRSFLRRLLIGGLAGAGIVGGVALAYLGLSYKPSFKHDSGASTVQVPSASQTGSMSVEEAIRKRRSVRTYKREPLKLKDVSQLLWAAQGTTDSLNGLRSAPSAGGLYPLEIYVVVGSGGVEGLSAGVYHYETLEEILTTVKEGDYLQQLQAAALDQSAVGASAVSFIVCGVFERTTSRYGQRGVQYVYQESGHAAENLYLQAASLHLGMVVIRAFSEPDVSRAIGSKSDETPLYVVPVGVPG